MGCLGAALRYQTVPGSPNRNQPGRLITDVPVHIGINDVLSRRTHARKRRAELVPVSRRVQIEKRIRKSGGVIKSPAQSKLAILVLESRREPQRRRNHRAVTRYQYIQE